ncbi:MAG TPA: CPBP family glutamic-type intramembrane protease [Myxococcota bacterium]|nr:CPBP family glutamic-type intramembrane protease [Myxococcota bacterium]
MRTGRALLERMGRGLDPERSDAGLPDAGARAQSRYRIRDDPEGRVLVCSEAPTLRVRIERGVAVTAAAARSAPGGTIFLDGAAQGEPFLDPQRGVYNLDHHEGCVRPFTLATCEQAMVLIRRGLDLRKRDWTIQANDVDLDALLAIWVLLNHLRLTGPDPRARAAVMPLLRLEGVIDAHGLELVDLAALPSELLQESRRRMDRLLGREQALKSTGLWGRTDPLEYAVDRLSALDAQIYSPDQFEDVAEIEELARFELCEGSVGVVCRAAVGLYEVEQQLRRYHGERLGLIVLQKGSREYSLRQVDPTLPIGLEEVYQLLNAVDPASEGSLAANRWGGSAEIGGSPRRTGTALEAAEIAAVCARAHLRGTLPTRIGRVVWTGLASFAAIGISWASIPAAHSLATWLPGLASRAPFWFGLVLCLFGSCFLGLVARHTPGLYGLRRPSGADAWWMLVPALCGALAGGVWIPALPWPPGPPGVAWVALLAFPLLPLGAEILFRGLVQGSLGWVLRMQRVGGPWLLSWPTLVSAALYAPWVLVLASISVLELPASGAAWNAPLWGALVFGAAAGVARERSESLLLPLLLHGICATVVLLVRALAA